MDAFLADDALAPEGADALFSERLVRLPRIPLAYAPPEDMPPVAPLPALANGYVTFGHFGRTERLNDTRHRDLGAHPPYRAAVAADPGQPAISGSCVPRPVPGTFRQPWHRSGKARPGLFNAAIERLGRLRHDRHRARSVPAQCRHDDHRGAVAGRARRVPGWRPRSAGSAPASCTRSGSTTGSPATPMPTWRAPSRQHPTSPRLRNCARGLRQRSPRRHCAMQPASHAPSSRRSARYGTNGARATVARLHRLYADGQSNERRRPGAADAATR